jgi:hypothetical protein
LVEGCLEKPLSTVTACSMVTQVKLKAHAGFGSKLEIIDITTIRLDILWGKGFSTLSQQERCDLFVSECGN